ncbi:trace amine-associated receptor 1-like, partial [Stylophora pistillata]|uniref:trace amine-associated receptor 1-like n=1 Tax=Stylophora pistillata TaxID=50429 RepID=UPI000C04A0F1
MDTWFWVFAWFLSILAMAGNGFVIFLVCGKRQLRTKTNMFIVSLAVADFSVGMIAVPSRFFCDLVTECTEGFKAGLPVMYMRVFIVFASGTNLTSLVLERYIAVVQPLKYLTLMKRNRVTQMVVTSWGIPFLFTLTLVSIELNLDYSVNGYLCLLFELILCLVLIICLVSMFLVVYKQKSRDRVLVKQLQFNQWVAKVKTQNSLALKWMALVTGVFLLSYGIFMRCSLLVVMGHQFCNDFQYKVPLQVINSGINPIVYAFFKRDIKQELKRS